MRNDKYNTGTSARLLKTDLVKPLTASVLNERLTGSKKAFPVFFNEGEIKLLGVVCGLLIPQRSTDKVVDLAALFDTRMASGQNKGWRYNALPPDKVLFKSGLKGVEDTAYLMYGEKFIFLSFEKQHTVLSMIQSGEAQGDTWQQLLPALFFKELLAALTELYYSHPIAKDDIGEVAYADGLGWNKIGLNEHESFEPLPLNGKLNA